MIFPALVLLIGVLLYRWAADKGEEFFLAFLILLPLWGPRCALLSLSARRAIELRWEDVFMIGLLMRAVLRGDARLAAGRMARGPIVFLAYAALLLLVKVVLLNDHPVVLYLALYVKLALHLTAVALYLPSVPLLSTEVFWKHFVRIAAIVLAVESLGVLYQTISWDFKFTNSLGRVFGLENWQSITGAYKKVDARAALLFDTEQVATGLVLVCLSLIVMYGSRRPWAWAGIALITVFLTTSKTGIVAMAFAAAVVFVSRRRQGLDVRRTQWALGALGLANALSVAFLFSARVQRWVISAAEQAVAVMRVVERVHPGLERRLRGFKTSSLVKRLGIVDEALRGFGGSWRRWLLGYGGFGMYDNNYLFILCVLGVIGPALFLAGHAWSAIAGARALGRVGETQRRVLSSLCVTMAIVLTLFALTGEPMRHVRFLWFLYPWLLAVSVKIAPEPAVDAGCAERTGRSRGRVR